MPGISVRARCSRGWGVGIGDDGSRKLVVNTLDEPDSSEERSKEETVKSSGE